MNKHFFEGNWDIVEGKLKQQWGKLTDDELKEIKGDSQELYGKLQKHYGYTKEEIDEQLDNFK